MIDIESKVFDTVAGVLRSEYSEISIYGEYVAVPSSFPCVTLVEDDNYVHRASQDENVENNVNVLYTLTVYSNKTPNRKAEAKAILAKADEVMNSLNFTRMLMSQIPNEDRTIYRIVAQYEATVSKGKDGVHHIYRR